MIPGRPVADVGCDHGLLLRALLADGRVPFGIGIDVHAEPLAGARALLAGYNVDLRLGDGLRPLGMDEVATVVVAGMHGGHLAKLTFSAAAVTERLVLGPHGADEQLRAALPGFRIIAEEVVEEGGILYPILVAERGEESRTWLHYGDPAVHRDLDRLRARARRDQERLGSLPRLTPTSAARLAEAERVLAIG